MTTTFIMEDRSRHREGSPATAFTFNSPLRKSLSFRRKPTKPMSFEKELTTSSGSRIQIFKELPNGSLHASEYNQLMSPRNPSSPQSVTSSGMNLSNSTTKLQFNEQGNVIFQRPSTHQTPIGSSIALSVPVNLASPHPSQSNLIEHHHYQQQQNYHQMLPSDQPVHVSIPSVSQVNQSEAVIGFSNVIESHPAVVHKSSHSHHHHQHSDGQSFKNNTTSDSESIPWHAIDKRLASEASEGEGELVYKKIITTREKVNKKSKDKFEDRTPSPVERIPLTVESRHKVVDLKSESVENLIDKLDHMINDLEIPPKVDSHQHHPSHQHYHTSVTEKTIINQKAEPDIRQSDSNIHSNLHDRRMRGKSNYSAHREQLEVKTIEQTPTTDVFEEIETITLQPIGKGVQDLESTVHQHSSTTTQRTMRSTTPSGMQRVVTPSFEQTSSQHRRMQHSSGSAAMMPPPAPFIRQGSNYEIHQESHHRYGSGNYTINGPSYSSHQQLQQQTVQHQQSAPISPGVHSLGGVQSRSNSMVSYGEGGLLGQDINSVLKAVQETSKTWYQPFISREEVITILQDMPPGSFLVRDSNTFPDAFGLALRVAAGPRRSKGGLRKYLDGMMKKLTKDDAGHQKKSASKEDLTTDNSTKKTENKAELVRHYLIEPVQPKGVRLKHFSNEPVFQTLAALIAQHTLQPIALPCRLVLPDLNSPTNQIITTQQSTGSAAGQNAEITSSMHTTQFTSTQGGVPPSPGMITTGSVLFLGCVEVESLTGAAALTKACGDIAALPPSATKLSECQLKLSSTEGITITDVARKNFFRRNFPIQLISFYGVDSKNRSYNVPEDVHKGLPKAKLFGFVTRKPGSTKEHNCFVLCEYDFNFTAHAAIKAMSKILGSVR